MKTILTIKTTTGDRTEKGIAVGQFLAVIQNGTLWTISHIPSGYAIAHFGSEPDAVSVATALDLSRASWDWARPEDIPEQTKAIVGKMFGSLSRSIKFHQAQK